MRRIFRYLLMGIIVVANIKCGGGLFSSPNMHKLTVSKTGTGASGGTITSTPPGISCGADCSEQFEEGTTVQLKATTNGNTIFEGWSGDCSGSSSTCTVYMDEDKNVVAEFRDASIPLYTLTVVKNGEGLVTSNPAGISCGIDCSEPYDTGTVVTLTASPANGYLFDGWGGDCSGISSTCTVTMNSDKTVIANFSETPPIYFDHFDYTSASELLNSGWSYGGGNAPGAVVGVSNSFVYAANYGSGSGWHGVEIVAQLDSTIDITTENFELSAYVTGICSNDVNDNGIIEIGLLNNLNTRIAAIIWAQRDNCCVDYDVIDDLDFSYGNIFAILPDGSYIFGNDGDYLSIAGTITIRKESGIVGLYFNNTLVSSAAFSGSGIISKIRVRIYSYGNTQPCPTMKVDWVRVKKLP